MYTQLQTLEGVLKNYVALLESHVIVFPGPLMHSVYTVLLTHLLHGAESFLEKLTSKFCS